MTELSRVRDAEHAEVVELEVVYDETELVEEPAGFDWESGISEWAEGARQEFVGKLRQARAAHGVVRRYGFGSMVQFAKEVGSSKTTVYDAARVWAVYGHIFEDGASEGLSARLETKGYSHLVISLRAPDPMRSAEEAHDADETTRQHEERLQKGEEEESGPAHLITQFRCPDCENWHPLSGVETREVPA